MGGEYGCRASPFSNLEIGLSLDAGSFRRCASISENMLGPFRPPGARGLVAELIGPSIERCTGVGRYVIGPGRIRRPLRDVAQQISLGVCPPSRFHIGPKPVIRLAARKVLLVGGPIRSIQAPAGDVRAFLLMHCRLPKQATSQ